MSPSWRFVDKCWVVFAWFVSDFSMTEWKRPGNDREPSVRVKKHVVPRFRHTITMRVYFISLPPHPTPPPRGRVRRFFPAIGLSDRVLLSSPVGVTVVRRSRQGACEPAGQGSRTEHARRSTDPSTRPVRTDTHRHRLRFKHTHTHTYVRPAARHPNAYCV